MSNQKDPKKFAKAYSRLKHWSHTQTTDNPEPYNIGLDCVAALYKYGDLSSLVPILPFTLALRGQPFGLDNHFPMEPIYKRKDVPFNMILKCGRQVSKCGRLNAVNGRTCIRKANGQQVNASDLKTGDKVIVMDRNWESSSRRILDIIKSGEQEVFELTTLMGSQVVLSGDHKLRTINGWTRVSDLKAKSPVAAFGKAGEFKDRYKPNAWVKLTAYMVASGCFGFHNNYYVSTSIAAVRNELYNVLRQGLMSKTVYIHEGEGNRWDSVHVKRDKDLHIDKHLQEDGIFNVPVLERKIPAWVFDLSREQTRLFISRLWATEHGVFGINRNGHPEIIFRHPSEQLAVDLRCLLIKLGIPASIKPYIPAGSPEGHRESYAVRVETSAGKRKFIDEFDDITGKPAPKEIVDLAQDRLDRVPSEVGDVVMQLKDQVESDSTGFLWRHKISLKKGQSARREDLPYYAQCFEQYKECDKEKIKFLRDLGEGDIIWDQVVSVVPLGKEECMDLEIEEVHNYCLDNLVSHNSTTLAASGVLRSATVPYLNTIYVTPLFEQIRRFSNNFVRPFILESPIKNLLTGEGTAGKDNSVFQRKFANESNMFFTFAFLDAERVRGIAGDCLCLDECQDINIDHLPVIESCLDASDLGIITMSGTPKTTDNTIHQEWLDSSQAHWVMKCESCSKWNIASIDHGLDQMIQKDGFCCRYCSQKLNPRNGSWYHFNKEKRLTYPGYHVPQVILPMHYNVPEKWYRLYLKKVKWPQYRYYNEVLGESCDVGTRLVTEQKLRESSKLPWKMDLHQALANRSRYDRVMVGVDWGGGAGGTVRRKRGQLVVEGGSPSFTVFAAVGFKAGSIHPELLYAERLSSDLPPDEEVKRIAELYNLFDAYIIAHDYGGAGFIRETMLIQASLPQNRIMPVIYVHAPNQPLINYQPPGGDKARHYYKVDKTRSLALLCAAINADMVQLPEWDEHSELLYKEFLALVEERMDRPNGADIYRITRNPSKSDDFVHALNFACAAQWHTSEQYPDMASRFGIDFNAQTFYEEPINW